MRPKYLFNLLKVSGWCVILCVSFVWSAHTTTDTINTYGLLKLILNFFPLMIIYLTNQFYFIPRLLFQDRRAQFIGANVVVLSMLLMFSSFVSDRDIIELFRINITAPKRPAYDLTFMARDLINYILMVGFVTSLQLMGRLERSEEALREAETAKVKVELANLRSQLNPHFLLNTLNNIYALTVIDADKAQKSIKELSLLLRYVLYDNLSDKVLLVREVEFLKNYIELMRIRLTKQVKLSVEYDLSPESTTQIAPLIFISLIENAFKHGVSAEQESFIDIKISNNIETGDVTLAIKNSNNAKNDSDKSGCGVGLDQVRRRLELQYHNSYSWEINDGSDVYESILTLKGCSA